MKHTQLKALLGLLVILVFFSLVKSELGTFRHSGDQSAAVGQSGSSYDFGSPILTVRSNSTEVNVLYAKLRVLLVQYERSKEINSLSDATPDVALKKKFDDLRVQLLNLHQEDVFSSIVSTGVADLQKYATQNDQKSFVTTYNSLISIISRQKTLLTQLQNKITLFQKEVPTATPVSLEMKLLYSSSFCRVQKGYFNIPANTDVPASCVEVFWNGSEVRTLRGTNDVATKRVVYPYLEVATILPSEDMSQMKFNDFSYFDAQDTFQTFGGETNSSVANFSKQKDDLIEANQPNTALFPRLPDNATRCYRLSLPAGLAPALQSGVQCYSRGKGFFVYTPPAATSGSFINAPVPAFQASNITSRQATFSWQTVARAVGYAIYREDELVKIVKSTEPLTYTEDAILMPETTYTYTIIPLNSLLNVPETLDTTALVTMEKPKMIFAEVWNWLRVPVAHADSNLGTKITLKTLPLPDIPKTGSVKILAILVKFRNTDLNDTDTALSVKQKLLDNQNSVAAFYKQNSFGKFQIDTVNSKVLGPYKLDKNDAPVGTIDKNTWNDFIKKKNIFEKINSQVIAKNPSLYLTDYPIIIYVLPQFGSIKDNPIAGQAEDIGDLQRLLSGEERNTIWINGVVPQSVYAHEIGHTLGLHHAQGALCETLDTLFKNCKLVYYGDLFDTMGYSYSYAHFDPYRKSILGWIGTQTITDSGKYTIGPTEMSTSRATFIDINQTLKAYLDYRDTSDPVLQSSSVPNFDFDGGDSLFYVKFISKDRSVPGNNFNDEADGYSYSPDIGSDSNNLRALILPKAYSYHYPEANWHIIPLSFSGPSSGVQAFVRFDDKTVVTAVLNNNPSTPKTIYVSWTPLKVLSNNGGYHLYRDAENSVQNPINVGSEKLTSFTDTITDTNPHTYTVIPYDAFTELPGKEYPMVASAPSNSVTLATVPTSPSAPGDLKLTVSNLCPKPGDTVNFSVDTSATPHDPELGTYIDFLKADPNYHYTPLEGIDLENFHDIGRIPHTLLVDNMSNVVRWDTGASEFDVLYGQTGSFSHKPVPTSGDSSYQITGYPTKCIQESGYCSRLSVLGHWRTGFVFDSNIVTLHIGGTGPQCVGNQ